MYWVMKADARDTDSDGFYRTMLKYAGPFELEEEADKKKYELLDQIEENMAHLRRNREEGMVPDESIDRAFQRLDAIAYSVVSDEELRQARASGIRIIK